MNRDESQRCVNEVIAMLIDFDTPLEICQKLSEKYKIGERQAYRFIAEARKKIAAEPAPDIETTRKVIVARLQGVCKKAAAQDKIDSEIRGIKLLAEINGLLNAENKPVENARPNTDPSEWVANATVAIASGGFEIPAGEPAPDLDPDDGPAT